MITGVHAARVWVDTGRERIGVGRLELAHAPVLENELRQRVLVSELLQHRFGGRWLPLGCLLQDRQLELVEQDALNLLR